MNTPTRRLGRGLESLIAGGGQATFPVQESTHESAPIIEESATSLSDSEPQELEINQISATSSDQLQELPIEQVFPNPHQPRKVIDPEAVRELAASIQSEGLLQPVVVRTTEAGYELIAGERRLRAHQHLGRTMILARVLEVTDLSSASLSLIENLQREELNPIEEALGYQSLIADFNLSQQEVSKRMGKSRSHIANLMRLLQLEDELKRLLSEGELSVGHAKVLLGVDDPERRLAVGRQAVLEGWTVRQIEEVLANGMVQNGSSVPRKGISSLLYDDLAKSASESLGRKVKIKTSSKGTGTISLAFKNEADLKNLLAKLES